MWASAAAVIHVAGPVASARRDLIALDRRLTRRVVRPPGTPPRGPGHALARHNALPTWGLLSLSLTALGPRGRRAARRALLAATVSSLTGDRMVKQLLRRERPRGAERASPSFPSGHACTGSAFATAVTCEWPAVGVIAIATSALVSTARVRDGEHHVSDIVGGTIWGIGTALVVRRLEDRTRADGGPGADRAV